MDVNVPALYLRDDPGAGLVIAGPYPESDARGMGGRVIVRIFNGDRALACVLEADQIRLLREFLNHGA